MTHGPYDVFHSSGLPIVDCKGADSETACCNAFLAVEHE